MKCAIRLAERWVNRRQHYSKTRVNGAYARALLKAIDKEKAAGENALKLAKADMYGARVAEDRAFLVKINPSLYQFAQYIAPGELRTLAMKCTSKEACTHADQVKMLNQFTVIVMEDIGYRCRSI